MTTRELIALAKSHFPNSPVSVRADVWDDEMTGMTGISLWVAELSMHFNGSTLEAVAEAFLKFQTGKKPEAETIIEEISDANQPL